MEFREPLPTITDVRQLEQVGFSSEQIAGLFSVKALYQRGVYHEDNPVNTSDNPLSAGSTSRVACKAKPRSRPW